MLKEDIPLYKLDLTAADKFNRVDFEYMNRKTVKNNHIVIPPKAPFYQKSFKMYDKAGAPLVEGVDYEFYGIMGELTRFTGKPVGLFVRLLKEELTEWYVDYQVVGNFSKLTSEILNLLHSIYEDDRFVLYENIKNKPLWFTPDIHKHDLAYEIFGFTDLAKQIRRIAEYMLVAKQADDVIIQMLQDNLDVYIQGFQKVLADLVNQHDANKMDAHGVTKEHLGLGKVDNFLTATLEETIEGLRDDLHITPYNAALVADAAAGRNDRLFPSGSLPILRYGSDTFIPPTINGSFEGLGGMFRRVGAIVEVDGTLLILQHRNNGKVRGLYFTRCANWKSQSANYEFTSYRYVHPTATAAGATLDTIINGSNRYVMVVGDSKKNLWWWCETNNTFNPERHILIPLTGAWVTEDMLSWNGRISDTPWDMATLMADEHYQEAFCIVQSYPAHELLDKRRPGWIPEWATMGPGWANNSTLVNAGYSLNIVTGGSGVITRAKVDYTHEVFGNNNDRYWTPWFPEVAIVDGKRVIKSFQAKFNTPAQLVWAFRGIHAYWVRQSPGKFGMHLEQTYNNVPTAGQAASGQCTFRAVVDVRGTGENVEVGILPAEGNKRLYNIDFALPVAEGNAEWGLYLKNVHSRDTPNGLDRVGSALLADGYIQYADGTGNSSFPSGYGITKTEWLTSPDKILTPSNPPYLYNERVKFFNETNPLGLGTLFLTQRPFVADSDNPASAGVIARQSMTTGSMWVYRPLGHLDAQWQHIVPPLLTVYDGVPHNHYAYQSVAKMPKLGVQTIIQTVMPVPGTDGKEAANRIFGASSLTNLMGANNGIPDVFNKMSGDGLWVSEQSIKPVGDEIIITPKTVINLVPAIKRVIVPVMVATGLTEEEVLASWSFGHALSPTGEWLGVMMCFCVRQPDVAVRAVVFRIAADGTPTVVDGTATYPDAYIGITSPVVQGHITHFNVITPNIRNSNYAGNNFAAAGMFISMPYRAINNGVPDTSGFTVAIVSGAQVDGSGGGTPISVSMSIKADGSIIDTMRPFDAQQWGSDASIVPCPYHGIADAGPSSAIFEGAAIGCQPIAKGGDFLYNIQVRQGEGTRLVGMSNILTQSYTVFFQEMKGVLLAGKVYDIPATHIDILNQDSNPANKVFYVYLYYSGGMARYIISTDVKPESSSQSMIAKVVTDATQIASITPYNRFSMDGAHISATRTGSAILSTSGSIYERGNTSTILLEGDYVP